MKQHYTLKSLLVIMFLLFGLKLQAEVSKQINVVTAGTLPTLMSSYEKNNITSLTLTGNLNGTDIRFIRWMAGVWDLGLDDNFRTGNLSVLDISGANIVAGGDYYYYDGSTEYYSLNTIGDYMFCDCPLLTSIKIPNSVTSIGAYSFYGCSGLTSVTFPNSVTSIGDRAFSGCSGLKSITIPNSVTSIDDYAFEDCSGLTSITIPNSVTSIGDRAFSGCSGLKLVTLSNNLTSIGGSAFFGCDRLYSITIPSTLTLLGNFAFYNCRNLKEIHCNASIPPLAYSSTFQDVDINTCKLYVPKGTYSSYWLAVGWGDFTNLIEDGGNSSLSLAINYANSGSVKLIVQMGISYTSEILPSEGWKINTVKFNNIDVTSQLDANNRYTTPAISQNSTLTVSFESKNTSVSQTQSDNIKVYTESESIVIEGVEFGEDISIYTESGALVQKTKVTEDIVKINVPIDNVYLVKIAHRTFKVAL